MVSEDLQIKQENCFVSRIMSKETSPANSSCRVYYGGASGAVPFVWESTPGTPKHASSGSTLPPLTPPPSYYSGGSFRPGSSSKSSKSGQFMRSLFSRFNNRRSSYVSPSLSSSWSTSSSSSHGSSPMGYMSRKRKFHLRRISGGSCWSPACWSIDGLNGNENDSNGFGSSRTSTSTSTCLGVSRRGVSLKRALFSIVGRNGSSGEGTD